MARADRGEPAHFPDPFLRRTDMVQVHRSRWGYHPCDYETFTLLKRLNAVCERARRRHAEWQRWNGKLPHNRLLCRKVRDAEGRVVGREVVGPRPEPALLPPFAHKKKVLSFWSEEGKRLKTGRPVDEAVFEDLGIPAAYRAARTPAASPELVRP